MSSYLNRICALSLALLPFAAAAEERVVARSTDGAAPLVVFRDGAGLRIDDGGREARVAAPPGLRLDAAVRLGQGWLLAGARPSDAGSELWLVRDGVEIAAPAGAARMRLDPRPLVSGQGLAGLAWLEGDGHRQLAVQFAPWRPEGGFGAVERIAPPGPGSQLALAAARLATGQNVLVWAGFDGEDDEIWAAWSTRAGWSAPVRVGGDNRVPDITPDIVATDRGALVAWNRFDGSEYQLVVAEFDGKSFSSPRAVGEPGAVDATFERHAGGLALLYRDARRGAWALTEISNRGVAGRAARWEASAVERPAVQWNPRGPVWTLGERAAATAWD